MKTIMPEQLRTARCLLRRPRASDAESVFRHYAADPEVSRYLGWTPHADLAATRKIVSYDEFRWIKGSAYTWMIHPDGLGEAAGMIELIPHEEHRASMGFALARSLWGLGLMSEVARAVLQLGLAHPAYYRIEAVCDVDNPGSARVMEKIGMRREGRLARFIVHPNVSPEPRDVFMYAAVR